MISQFGIIVLFGVVAILFLIFMFFISSLIRKQKPNIEKLSTYECGEEAIGAIGFGTFNMRYYILAIIFLLFDVEILLLFPWAEVFMNKDLNPSWTVWALVELTIFVIVLAIGLAYAWAKGHLDWNNHLVVKQPHDIPLAYKTFNKER